MKISEKEYNSLLQMLLSPDKENKIIALEVMSNLDFDQNLVYIICLLREGCSGFSFIIPNVIIQKLLNYNLKPSELIYSTKPFVFHLLQTKITKELSNNEWGFLDKNLRPRNIKLYIKY